MVMRVFSVLLLLAQIALSLGGRAAVLCFEADGTVVIEARGDACCEEKAPAHKSSGPALAPDAADCCFDLPLGQALGGERPRAPEAVSPPALASATLTFTSALEAARACLAAAAVIDPPGARSLLAALRTVVLLR